MIGNAVLREVVGANLFAAVTRAYHRLAFFGEGLLLLLLLHLIETGSQYTHGLLTVFDLRLLVLAAHDSIGRQVRNANSRVRRVDRLAARAGRAKSVDADVFRGNL